MYLWAFLLLATATSSVYSMTQRTCDCAHDDAALDVLTKLVTGLSFQSLKSASLGGLIPSLVTLVGVSIGVPTVTHCKTADGPDRNQLNIVAEVEIGCQGQAPVNAKVQVTATLDLKLTPDGKVEHVLREDTLSVTVNALGTSIPVLSQTLLDAVNPILKASFSSCTRALITHLNFLKKAFSETFPCCGDHQCRYEPTQVKQEGGDAVTTCNLKLDGETVKDESPGATAPSSLPAGALAFWSTSGSIISRLVTTATSGKTVIIGVPEGYNVGDWSSDGKNLFIKLTIGGLQSCKIKTEGPVVKLQTTVSVTYNGEEVLSANAIITAQTSIVAENNVLGCNVADSSFTIDVDLTTAKSTCKCKDKALQQLIAILKAQSNSCFAILKSALKQLFAIKALLSPTKSTTPGGGKTKCLCDEQEEKINCIVPKTTY